MISTATVASVVVLLDDGNLVLRYGSNSTPPIWQSFDHPTHTFLPGSKLGYNKLTHTNRILTSWRNREDPAVGLFSVEVDRNEKRYLLIWNRSVEYWTSGKWDGQIFSLVPEMRLNYIADFSFVDNANERYITYSLNNPSFISRLVIDNSGQIQQLSWVETSRQWNLFWSQPRDLCHVNGGCGAFGVCNQQTLPSCDCLTDYVPRSHTDWNLGDFSGGCVRKTEWNCSVKIKKPMFILSYVQGSFDENEALSLDELACRRSCLGECDCNAYTFISNICQHWNRENLNNMSHGFVSSNSYPHTSPLYIKVSSSDRLKSNAKINTNVLVAGIVSGVLGLVFLCSIGVIFYRRVKRQGPELLSEQDRKDLDVPFFEFKRILSATENFSLANKLGQGGFGPVYKGKFPGGAEMAVKRLSSQSGQDRTLCTGYMAPEYALNGFFSVKSDVFSFGIIILEIISGKINAGYYHNQQAFSLVSYAWDLWKEKKPLDLLDPTLVESCNSIEVLRCMIVGLLCIQEDPQDRPTMKNVLLMLGMDIESLPDPKEPAFVSKAHIHSSPSYASETENLLNITEEEGR
ncbi:hypothetical protein L1987_68864 [Smallanthus sonchifolius]|uniref:Uncharacterized protein n=1 Tax=Smallanthus sonchifolius TaxID=185202 RepID=A0ACB9B5U4_9ASTR|nr:hypothetical protein L1987_68864 [Smallanthus sonchifolius]